ncbi:MAG: RNA polymerase sigma factor [Myxococcales bacterium]
MFQPLMSQIPEAPAKPSRGNLLRLRPGVISDKELVEQLQRKEPAAVSHLISSYSNVVRRSLFRVLGSAYDIDDLEQDTFVTVLDRCHTLRDPSALRSFVVSVAMRLARNELRKRAIRRFVGLDTLAEHTTSPAYDPVTAERFRHLYRALDRLESSGRIAYVLRHVEGYELAEVAAACGCSLSTVKRWLSRAESKLKESARRDPVLSKLMMERLEAEPPPTSRISELPTDGGQS